MKQDQNTPDTIFSRRFRGWVARAAGQVLEPYEFDPGELGDEEVEIAVRHCGLCHSDLSVINNEWGISHYPVIPGHEAVGYIVALGNRVSGLQIGQRVGVGWSASSCMHCRTCLSGDLHLCATTTPTIIGHHGAFADRVRASWQWVIPLPDGLDMTDAGPLLCGGVTVFSPLLTYQISPTSRIGVVGIGGLGHMALQFAAAWGCEVVALTSSLSKAQEAMALGAHRVVSGTDKVAVAALAGCFDLLLVTANAPLDWPAMIATLAPKGRMHIVGAVLEPVPVAAFSLIMGQRSISGSPTGSPVTMTAMLEFAARHHIVPQTEHFPMSRVNDALAHLQAGKARYRVVLDADFA